MWRSAAALTVALTLAGSPARAQISTSATPIYHGTLRILHPGVGSFDTSTGIGTLRVRRWQLELRQGSNGIFPDKEPVVVALGDESFRLEAGALTRSRNGKVFRYRAAPGAISRGIRSFRIAQRTTTVYLVSFTLIGVDLSQLVLQNPVCRPLAVIVGDDDGFTGVDLMTRPAFSRHLAIPRACTENTWPWIQS